MPREVVDSPSLEAEVKGKRKELEKTGKKRKDENILLKNLNISKRMACKKREAKSGAHQQETDLDRWGDEKNHSP